MVRVRLDSSTNTNLSNIVAYFRLMRTKLSKHVHPLPLKPMMHIEFFTYFRKIYKCFHIFVQFTCFCLIYVFLLSIVSTMMHLCIMLQLYTECTPLCQRNKPNYYG